MKKFIIMCALTIIFLSCDFKVPRANSTQGFNRDFIQEPLSVEIFTLTENRVKLSFTNTTDEKFSVFRGAIPSDKPEQEIFKVFDGINYIPYSGILAKRIENDKYNWVVFEPGQTKNYDVNLSGSYKFLKNTYHDVYYNFEIIIKYLDGIIERVEIKSSPVLFLYREIGRTVSNPVKCNSSQLKLLNGSKDIGSKITVRAKNYITKKKTDSLFVRWFGKPSKDHLSKLTNGFNNMTNSFRKSWKYSCEDISFNNTCKGVVAFVMKNRPQEVWVCMNNFKGSPNNYKGGVMIHEAAHWNVNFGADDYGYGKKTGLALAKSSPSKAVRCSNNIEYYSLETTDIGNPPGDPDPPGDPGPIKPDITMRKRVWQSGERIEILCRGLDPNKKYVIGAFPRVKGKNNDNDNPWKTRKIKWKKSGSVFMRLYRLGKGEFHLYRPGSNVILDEVNFIIKK